MRCTTMDLARSHYDFSYLTNKVVTLDGDRAAAVKPDRSAVIEVPEAIAAVRKSQGPTRIVVGHTA
jgi:hypothetical protein